MEIAPDVAAHDFELAVDGLDDVGGGQEAADDIGGVEESQVMTPLFADLADEAGGAGLEVLAEILELGGGDLGVPGRFQGKDLLIEFGGIGFAEVALGIALLR
ncbi:MAG TPA: hypothetical protein VGX94_01850 [Terriglobia bacterium]|nr:hypothetical protein [Terriglobia bacterium]